MYSLYWIKTEEHTNPTEEGYIGITSQSVEKRFLDHRYNTKNKHLKNRCRMKNVHVVCLHERLSREEAVLYEFFYRPLENIGWNINRGGDIPPSRSGKVSPKSLLKGEHRTEKQKEGSKKRAEKIKGNNFSGQRKNKVNYSKPCLYCNTVFDPVYEKRKKYCCISCAAKHRSESTSYIEKISKMSLERWADNNFKNSVSVKIKKSLDAKRKNQSIQEE